jgi:hypothetical protein
MVLLVQPELPVHKVLHQLLLVLLDTQVLPEQLAQQVHKVQLVIPEQLDQLVRLVHKVLLDQQVRKV